MRVGAIVVAAGQSRRMGGRDKLWLPLGDLPLLGHTLAALAAVAEIGQFVVVSSSEGLRHLTELRAEPTMLCCWSVSASPSPPSPATPTTSRSAPPKTYRSSSCICSNAKWCLRIVRFLAPLQRGAGDGAGVRDASRPRSPPVMQRSV